MPVTYFYMNIIHIRNFGVRLVCFDDHLPLQDSSSAATEHQSKARKVKPEPVTQPTEDFIVHKSVDDLRSGGYQYRVDTDFAGALPGQGEIMFSDGDKGDNSSMTWSYRHPRLISHIRAMPIPFNVSREDIEERIRVCISFKSVELGGLGSV